MASNFNIETTGTHAEIVAKDPMQPGAPGMGIKLMLQSMLLITIGYPDASDVASQPQPATGYNKNTKKGQKKTRPDRLGMDMSEQFFADLQTAVTKQLSKVARTAIGTFAQTEIQRNVAPAMTLNDLKAFFEGGKLKTIQFAAQEGTKLYVTVWRGATQLIFQVTDPNKAPKKLDKLPFANVDDEQVGLSVQCIKMYVKLALSLSEDKKTIVCTPEYTSDSLLLTNRKPAVADLMAKAGFTFTAAANDDVEDFATGGGAAGAPLDFVFNPDSESDTEDDDGAGGGAAAAAAMDTVEEEDSEKAPAAKRSRGGAKK
jgi:hypothetical protein